MMVRPRVGVSSPPHRLRGDRARLPPCVVEAATPCVQVLLVMLRGKKRFRVAGKALGSSVAIDHMLQPGDAIYIPAGCFHSGAACHTRCPAR